MSSKSFWMTLLASVSGLFGCTLEGDNYHRVDVDEFEQALADSTIFRLDVRSKDEYEVSHIAGAVHIDVMLDSFKKKALATFPAESTIAVYCRSGKRSQKAASILVKNHYKVIELKTGFNGWTEAGKPVEN